MKKLFIIGNGFDIQHEIKSKYQDFHLYFRSTYMNKELIDRSFDDFFPWKYHLPRTKFLRGHYFDEDLINVFGFIDYCLTKSENMRTIHNFHVNSDWWAIENTLANLCLYEFFDEENDYLYDDDYSVQDKLYDIAECFKYLYRIFFHWVKQIDINAVAPIKSFQLLFDSENDIFFTFNYTRTLEDVYGVKQVRHVHGEQGEGLLFGHKKEVDINSFMQNNGIPNCCSHEAKVLMELLEKDTERNSANMSPYYLFLDKDITDIYSYGFSFSEVDFPYIRDICKSLDTSGIVWHLADFDSAEKRKEYENRIINCGFAGKFKAFHIDNPGLRKQNIIDPYKKYLIEQRRHMGISRFALQQFLLDYYTIGYIRPTERSWRQSDWMMLPRLIWMYVLAIAERITKPFRRLRKNR